MYCLLRTIGRNRSTIVTVSGGLAMPWCISVIGVPWHAPPVAAQSGPGTASTHASSHRIGRVAMTRALRVFV
jgi:hypothetical protein